MNRQTNDETEKKELKIQIQTGKTWKIHVRTDRNKQNERDSKDKRKKKRPTDAKTGRNNRNTERRKQIKGKKRLFYCKTGNLFKIKFKNFFSDSFFVRFDRQESPGQIQSRRTLRRS